VGANTAELGALAVPMIVLLPTQLRRHASLGWYQVCWQIYQLWELAWQVINWLALRQLGLLAWPI